MKKIPKKFIQDRFIDYMEDEFLPHVCRGLVAVFSIGLILISVPILIFSLPFYGISRLLGPFIKEETHEEV